MNRTNSSNKTSKIVAWSMCGLLPLALIGTANVKALDLPGFESRFVYQVDHRATSAANLTDYQIALDFDSATEIGAGRMQADCDDIRVTQGVACSTPALAHWVEFGTCNTAHTRVWVRLSSVAAGGLSYVTLHTNNAAALNAEEPNQVFSFFDDFTNLSLPQWNRIGDGTLARITDFGDLGNLNDDREVLQFANGTNAIFTKANVMTAGATELVVSGVLAGRANTQVELGVGAIAGTNLTSSTRLWNGASWGSSDRGAAMASSDATLASASCYTQDFGTNGVWAEMHAAGVERGPLVYSFRYENTGTQTVATLNREGLPQDSYQASSIIGCQTSTSLPALLVLAPNWDGPTDTYQYLSFAFVRNWTAVAPTITRVVALANLCTQCAAGDSICNDFNDCTADMCVNDGCGFTNVPAGTSCSIASQAGACNAVGVCIPGVVPVDAGTDSGIDSGVRDSSTSFDSSTSIDSGSTDSGTRDSARADGTVDAGDSGTATGSLSGGACGCRMSRSENGSYAWVSIFGLMALLRLRKRSKKN